METDLSLRYNYAPPASRRADGTNPLLVMAHGYGADENDLFSRAGEFPAVFHVVAPRAPLDLPYGGAAWYSLDFQGNRMISDIPQAVAARERLAEFVAEAARKYGVASHDVWLLGFSQGAILSYGILSRYPERARYYLPLSGYIEPGIVGPEVAPGDRSAIKVLAMHGTQDPVIPIEAGRRVQDFLKRLGVDFRFHEFPIGHGISREGMGCIRTWVEEGLKRK